MSMSTAEHAERSFFLPGERQDLFKDLLSHLRPEPEPTTPPLAPALVGPKGEHIALPREVFDVLCVVVELMAEGRAITLAPVHQRLTTQEAADLLGISRQAFLDVLKAGEVGFETIGRHRRVLLTDVLEYKEQRSRRRRESLERLRDISHESGMYEKTAVPKPTR